MQMSRNYYGLQFCCRQNCGHTMIHVVGCSMIRPGVTQPAYDAFTSELGIHSAIPRTPPPPPTPPCPGAVLLKCAVVIDSQREPPLLNAPGGGKERELRRKKCAIAAGRRVGRPPWCLVLVLTKRGIHSTKQANLYWTNKYMHNGFPSGTTEVRELKSTGPKGMGGICAWRPQWE